MEKSQPHDSPRRPQRHASEPVAPTLEDDELLAVRIPVDDCGNHLVVDWHRLLSEQVHVGRYCQRPPLAARVNQMEEGSRALLAPILTVL